MHPFKETHAQSGQSLRKMGAEIEGIEGGNYCPLHIKGKNLNGIHYKLPVASAQVKSAILLASLYSKGKTIIIEPKVQEIILKL